MEQKQTKEINQVLQDAARAVVQDPVTLTVGITEQSWLRRWLQSKGLLAQKRQLVIRPATLGTLARISRLLLTIDRKMLSGQDVLEGNYLLARAHGDTLAEIVALAVHNQKGEPAAWLKRLVLEQFTQAELITAMRIILHQMDIKSFMTAIVSIRGLNLLETSPTTPEETIAPGI
jgi:hypothetical protein